MRQPRGVQLDYLTPKSLHKNSRDVHKCTEHCNHNYTNTYNNGFLLKVRLYTLIKIPITDKRYVEKSQS